MNFVASLPGAFRALFAGRLHTRVPATIRSRWRVAAGGGDILTRFGITEWFQVGKFIAVLFLFAGFLVSTEVFRQLRVPFTSVTFGRIRLESPEQQRLAEAADSAGEESGASQAHA